MYCGVHTYSQTLTILQIHPQQSITTTINIILSLIIGIIIGHCSQFARTTLQLQIDPRLIHDDEEDEDDGWE
jgi:hypothetical protein